MMASWLATIFPALVVLTVVASAALAVRLERKMSRAAHSAGPAQTEQPRPPGQEKTPWELNAIEDQLRLTTHPGGAAVPRYDLTATLNRLLSAAGFSEPNQQLAITANEAQLSAAVTRLEEHLGLAPIDSPPPQPLPEPLPLPVSEPLPGSAPPSGSEPTPETLPETK